MKKILTILLIITTNLSLCRAQTYKSLGSVPLLVTASELQVTNPIPPPPDLTNPPSIQGDINDIIAHIVSTNWYFAAYYLHAPGLQHKEGGGIAGFFPLNNYVLTGWRVDYTDGSFWMPSGQATLQLPITPISSWKWLTFTPFGFVGVGIPLAGAHVAGVVVPGATPKNNNGQPTAILGLGGAISLWKNSNPTAKFRSFELIGDKETWTGFPGQQWRIGAVGHVWF